MGNFCCQQDRDNREEFKIKKKRLSGVSTNSNDANPQKQLKRSEKQIVQILSNSKQRVSRRQNSPKITKLKVISEIGKGGQAEVFKINVETDQPRLRYSLGNNQTSFALKRIDIKSQKKNQRSLEIASQLLIQNDCPFLIKGFFCCKSQKYLYECMKLAEGGDLTSFMETTTGKGDAFRKLGQEGIKMVIAGIILGLEYFHQRSYTYCDLKTDNVLIGSDGYPMLADFQLLKEDKNILSTDFEGTITGVGPEIFTKKTFDKGLDLWALGVLIFTLTYNESPFSVEQIVDKGFVKQCQRKQNKYRLKRKKTAEALIDLINSLLKIDPQKRLGYKCIEQIKNHIFFYNFPWDEYSQKKIPNPLADIIKKYPLKSVIATRNDINRLNSK